MVLKKDIEIWQKNLKSYAGHIAEESGNAGSRIKSDDIIRNQKKDEREKTSLT